MDTVTLWSGSYGCLCFMSCLDLHISVKHYHSVNPILVVEFRTVEHCLFTCSASVKEGSKKICEKAVMLGSCDKSQIFFTVKRRGWGVSVVKKLGESSRNNDY